MRDIYCNAETADKWKRVADALKRATDAVAEAQLIMILELGITDGRPLGIIDAAADAVNGQSYMFTPQPEWMGGERWKTRLPHVVLSNLN